jgi:chloride channel protein, CIC family
VRRPPTLVSGRASRQLVLAGLVGGVVGLVVAAFDWLTTELLFEVTYELPTWQQALAPGLGLLGATLLLRYPGRKASPATADEYLRAFHDRSSRLPLRLVPVRLAAGLATIGSGGALGLEGPAIYAGAGIGDTVQHRLSRYFGREETRLLLVAGAAAGVAAIFKTPATGVVFALEVPYRSDLARRSLLPALVSSVCSYLVFIALTGTDPVFPSFGIRPTLEWPGVVGALAIGVLAGFAARGFAWLVRRAKAMDGAVRLRWRLAGAAVVLGGLVIVSQEVFDETLTLGPGYAAVSWAADPDHGVGLVVLLLALRVVSTVTTVGAGGTGGLFIPLAAQGVLLGRAVGDVLGQAESSLYPTIGLAAFLGAGYRVPLAAVMFVAESTGGAAYVVPALLAAAVSQLVTGPNSVTTYQRDRGRGHLEERLDLPIATALDADVLTVPPDATVEEYMWMHALGRRQRSVPVVDGSRYLGMCVLADVVDLDRARWPSTLVGDVVRDDAPAVRASWTLRQALATMEDADADVVAVVEDDEGDRSKFVGVVRTADLLALGDILDETGG